MFSVVSSIQPFEPTPALGMEQFPHYQPPGGGLGIRGRGMGGASGGVSPNMIGGGGMMEGFVKKEKLDPGYGDPVESKHPHLSYSLYH